MLNNNLMEVDFNGSLTGSRLHQLAQLANLVLSLAQLSPSLLSLFSVYLSPSFISCSSCLFCVSTRPFFVYMTSYLCIITAIITSSVTIYTFIVFGRQRKLFQTPVVILTLNTLDLASSNLVRRAKTENETAMNTSDPYIKIKKKANK